MDYLMGFINWIKKKNDNFIKIYKVKQLTSFSLKD